jgi:glutathione synthase/RimK-type ligase-like ATP-grasp enzyme
MAQDLIDSDGSDYRFLVTGGRTRLVIKRIGSGDSHLNNTSQGATTEVVPLENIDESVLLVVHKMSSALHREVTGIDIMFDKTTSKPYFLEANPIPQIATGSNVELKLDALAEALREAAEGENR